MPKREVSIHDIAKEAGVSIATVSRVINQSSKVSDASRERVCAAIQKFGYSPSGTARSLRTKKSKAVGLVVPDIGNPFFCQLLQGITRVADQNGYHVLLFNTEETVERQNKVLQSIREHRLCGLIVIPIEKNDPLTLRCLLDYKEHGTPVVFLDRDMDNPLFDRVVSDDSQGVFQAINALLQAGHRKIAILAGSQESRPGRMRLDGYTRALTAAGIPLQDAYIRQSNFFDVQCACDQTKALLQLEDPPTAVFTSNNTMTYGFLKACGEMGLTVGRDIGLIGFDDIEMLGWLNYPVSVVSRPVPDMGEQAMELLLNCLDKPDGEPCVHRVVPTELILRGSETASPENRQNKGVSYES